jgi:hypothetical protein
MADLITSSFATAALAAGGITPTAAQTSYLANAITAASRAVERYCQRIFAQANYDEVRQPQAGQWDRNEPDTVMLRYPPVSLVSRVSSGRTTALTIANTDSVTNQRATVSLVWTGDPEVQATATGLSLTRVASGAVATTSLAFSTYATIQSLANAINALGSGWVATVGANMGNWSTLDSGGMFSELYAPAGTQGALNQASGLGARFDVFSVDLQSWDYDSSNGVIFLSPQGGNILSGPGAPQLFGVSDPLDGFVTGGGQWRAPVRVMYTGGYATIPVGVQQATAEVVKAMLERLATDTTLSSESDGPYTYDAVAVSALEVIPAPAKQALSQYRIYRA